MSPTTPYVYKVLCFSYLYGGLRSYWESRVTIGGRSKSLPQPASPAVLRPRPCRRCKSGPLRSFFFPSTRRAARLFFQGPDLTDGGAAQKQPAYDILFSQDFHLGRPRGFLLVHFVLVISRQTALLGRGNVSLLTVGVTATEIFVISKPPTLWYAGLLVGKDKNEPFLIVREKACGSAASEAYSIICQLVTF